MKRILILYFIFITISIQAQNLYKKEALKKFEAEDYSEAIKLLEKALIESPIDAEIYYFLGWFNHYNAYDSRPLKGYDFNSSKKIFNYLDKAIELNSNYGDAKYFYGAECSGNAFLAMQNNNLKKLKYFYKLAYNKGAYPKWLIEYGKNILENCQKNAILFTAGNADFDVCMYLQLHEGIRKDITLIPLGNIDRPWYVKFLKNGLKGGVKKIDLSLSDTQIMDIHPFKWKTTNIQIKVSDEESQNYGLSNNYFNWEVNPDLTSERLHSKSENEIAKKRTYLSPQRAILLQIIEDNYKTRPIFFSNYASSSLYGGLDNQFENYGLISKLTPIHTKNTKWEINFEMLDKIINENSISNFNLISKTDIPRISGLIKFSYFSIFTNLFDKKSSCPNCIYKLKELHKDYLEVGFSRQFNDHLNSIFEK